MGLAPEWELARVPVQALELVPVPELALVQGRVPVPVWRRRAIAPASTPEKRLLIIRTSSFYFLLFPLVIFEFSTILHQCPPPFIANRKTAIAGKLT